MQASLPKPNHLRPNFLCYYFCIIFSQEREVLVRSNERLRQSIETIESKITDLQEKLRTSENQGVDLSNQIALLEKQKTALISDRKVFEANYFNLEGHLSAIREALSNRKDDTVPLGEHNRLLDKMEDLQFYLSTFGEALDVAAEEASKPLPRYPDYSTDDSWR